MRQQSPVVSAYNYGYTAGYKDRHSARAIEHRACDREPNGYPQWLAGWEEGQKHRRRDFPPEAMLYEPRWPLPPPNQCKGIGMKRVYNMTIWAVQTKVLHKDARGQEYAVWELVPYLTELEFRTSKNIERVLHYPMFPTRQAARVWKRNSCPSYGRHSQMRIRPVSLIELVANMPEGVCTIVRSLDEVAVD